MTKAQQRCLEAGITPEYCLENHGVCLHCGACRTCSSGCGCTEPHRTCPPPGCGGCAEYDPDEAAPLDGATHAWCRDASGGMVPAVRCGDCSTRVPDEREDGDPISSGEICCDCARPLALASEEEEG